MIKPRRRREDHFIEYIGVYFVVTLVVGFFMGLLYAIFNSY